MNDIKQNALILFGCFAAIIIIGVGALAVNRRNDMFGLSDYKDPNSIAPLVPNDTSKAIARDVEYYPVFVPMPVNNRMIILPR